MFKTIRLRPLRSILPSIAVASTLAYSYHLYTKHTTLPSPFGFHNNALSKIHLDSAASPTLGSTSVSAANATTEVKVDDSILPFPTHISKSPYVSQSYTLLGHGVRAVTFMSFKVYGVGIYIADSDIAKARSLLQSYAKANPPPPSARADEGVSSSLVRQNLKESLMNPVESEQIIDELLSHGVHFLIRLSPVRNTDFNHLKDGLIKSILAHPRSKSGENKEREELSLGLDELREIMGKTRGSVPKDDLLVLEQVSSSDKFNISYVKQNKKTKSKNDEASEGVTAVKEMGSVSKPIVAKTLLLQYLSGKKPLSESLRKSCMQGFADIAE